MKKQLLSGLAILIPILIAIITIKIFINILTAPFFDIVHAGLLAIEKAKDLQPEQHLFLTNVICSALALLVLAILSLILGFFANKFFMKFLLKLLEGVFKRIPVIKTIFKITKDLSSQFFNENQEIFKKTVLTAFPGKDTVAIGFITAEVTGLIKEASGGLDLCVFIPTSPHPVSGFVLLTSKKAVKEIDVSIDDAFRFILSCGAASIEPTEKK